MSVAEVMRTEISGRLEKSWAASSSHGTTAAIVAGDEPGAAPVAGVASGVWAAVAGSAPLPMSNRPRSMRYAIRLGMNLITMFKVLDRAATMRPWMRSSRTRSCRAAPDAPSVPGSTERRVRGPDQEPQVLTESALLHHPASREVAAQRIVIHGDAESGRGVGDNGDWRSVIGG